MTRRVMDVLASHRSGDDSPASSAPSPSSAMPSRTGRGEFSTRRGCSCWAELEGLSLPRRGLEAKMLSAMAFTRSCPSSPRSIRYTDRARMTRGGSCCSCCCAGGWSTPTAVALPAVLVVMVAFTLVVITAPGSVWREKSKASRTAEKEALWEVVRCGSR